MAFLDEVMASSILDAMTGQEGDRKGKTASTRRRRGLEALAGTLPRVAARALGRRGFADAGLIADWPKVVGSELAASCAPLRLSFPNRQERREGSLLLRVEPAAALELQHLAPLLLERINIYFGYRAVAQLKFLQGPLRQSRRPKRTPTPAKLSGEDPLSDRLSEVKDQELETALRRFSESFRARQKR